MDGGDVAWVRNYHSRFIIPLFLLIVNIQMELQFSSGPVSLSSLFLLVFMHLSVFPNPHLSCLSSFYLAVSAIFFSAALWDSVCEYLINRRDLMGLHRSEQFSRWSISSHASLIHIPSPNLTNTFYFSTFPVYTCTALQ